MPHLFSNKSIKDYKIGRTIGKGSYALVKVAKEIKTRKTVVLKIYSKMSLFDK